MGSSVISSPSLPVSPNRQEKQSTFSLLPLIINAHYLLCFFTVCWFCALVFWLGSMQMCSYFICFRIWSNFRVPGGTFWAKYQLKASGLPKLILVLFHSDRVSLCFLPQQLMFSFDFIVDLSWWKFACFKSMIFSFSSIFFLRIANSLISYSLSPSCFSMS